MKKITKVLLLYAIYPNKNDFRKIQMLGISYLQSVIKKKGIECDRKDTGIYRKKFNEEDIVKEIIDNNYDLVGFSILYANTELSLKIAKKVKSINKNIIILFGGMNATILHQELIDKYKFIDVIMRGESEESISELIDDYNEHGRFTKIIDNCTYQKINGEKTYAKSIGKILDLDKLPFPNRKDTFKYSFRIDKENNKRLYNVGISSSRGCPYHCVFCAVPSTKLNWRFRSSQNVIQEIKQVYKKKNDIFIIFLDDNFFVKPDRCLEIAKGMYQIANKPIPFSFATRADQLIRADVELLKELKQYGCYSIEIGIENGSDKFLKRMKKGTTVVDNEKALKILREVGIETSIDYIMYDNETTKEELIENFEFLKRNDLIGTYPPVLYNQTFPYPGTEFSTYNINMSDYYKDQRVKIIYDNMIRFAVNYQTKLNILFDKLKDMNLSKIELLDFLWIRNIPYVFFEKQLNSNESYENLITNLKVNEKINKLEKKY